MNIPPTKPTPQPPPSPPLSAIEKGECANCGSKEPWLFHRVMVRGMDRRVCTSCTLRLHPTWFCPSCLEFFDHSPSSSSSSSSTSTQRFMSCIKCLSSTHLYCIPSPPPPSSSFLCIPCSKPNFTFFPNSNSPIDKTLALVLLCAAKISCVSMAKHLSTVRARADRAVREAAMARKRAKEALDRCAVIEKAKRVEGSLEVSASRNLGVGMGNTNNNHNVVVCKKEEFNGFIGGQGNVRVPSEVLPLPQPGNQNGANGNDGNLDLERVRSCGRIVDIGSAT
ncbi:uncharacterized protein LOC113873218 [Abrus precatorius]|uniref:Uncharacterized protein LOC113873218 n=1 Tax=Abrus precatorius TaxID=3816 RepID=A0A8B8MIJ9_ABRPR|nr:uncharacterized protein LOC113873218 [Abrus precatorius]